MPNMSQFRSLKQRFEETRMLPKKRAVTPPRNNIVKRIVEAFEMKYGNRRVKTASSLNARSTDMACQNNAQQESFDPQCASFSNPVRIVRTSKEAEDTLDGFVNNQEMDNVKKMTKVRLESVNNDIDSNEKDNYWNNIKKRSNMSLDPYNVRDKIVESGSIEPNPTSSTSVSNRSEGKSSIAWRHIFSNVNQDSKFKAQKRIWPNKPKKDEFWNIKRQGQFFSNPPVSNEFLRKCEKAKSACLNTLLNSSMKDNSQNKEDYDVDEILMIIDTLDESGNSYKNLQVDMLDVFDSEEERVEVPKAEDDSRFVEISLKSPDNAQNSGSDLQSNLSDESMEYFERLNETYLTFKNKTDNQESVQNAKTRLSTIDKKSARDANSSAEPRANAEEKCTKWMPTLCNKLPPIKLLKKLLLVSNKSTQHIMEKKIKRFDNIKEHLQRAQSQPQQRPPQISSDSGYGTMYDDLHFSSISAMSKSSPTPDTRYNVSPTFKTFCTGDTRRDSHSHGIKKWDCRLKLDKELKEEVATNHGFTRSTPNITIAEPRQIPLARVSNYEIQTPLETPPFVSVTRINEMVEQSEIREPQLWCSDTFAAPAASTPRRKNDRSRRQWHESAPALNKIGENLFHDYYKQITRDEPRSNISHDIEEATASSNINPPFGTRSCAQSDSCFATVRPRNFGGKSFGVKRNNIVFL